LLGIQELGDEPLTAAAEEPFLAYGFIAVNNSRTNPFTTPLQEPLAITSLSL
jgi:hypothetical protein